MLPGPEGVGETPLGSKALLSLAASQLVTMHDLKQGLGPSGTAGVRKSASNKYKLKVGAPGAPGRAAALPVGREVEGGGAPPRVGLAHALSPQDPGCWRGQVPRVLPSQAHTFISGPPTVVAVSRGSSALPTVRGWG